ncbi:MAG: hypothetical protein NTY92_01470 [Nitrosospira sp.]|nr:hypothetical protein [Nitrosospira sp.]
MTAILSADSVKFPLTGIGRYTNAFYNVGIEEDLTIKELAETIIKTLNKVP